MKNFRLYNTTTDFENNKSKRDELGNRIILKYTTTEENQAINLFYDQDIMNSLVQKCKILETGEEISTYQYIFLILECMK